MALVLLTLTFAGAAGRAAAGALGIGSLMIVTQAGLSPIRIGGFIAEADVQTEYGMLADQSVRRFEQLTEQAARDTRATDRAAVSSPGDSDPAGHPVRDIRFDKVSFRYGPHGALVLDELDLTIPAGQSLAIVGLNGAGKTTLVKLLARRYEPLSGTIRIDDEDIRRPARRDPVQRGRAADRGDAARRRRGVRIHAPGPSGARRPARQPPLVG